MLWSIAFDRLGVVVSDLYFVDPALDQGADGAERGVRLELRLFERDPLKGSVYSAVPIRVDRPVWRLDLLETADSEPGSLNRAHHHPRFAEWNPGRRKFDPELSADPVEWLRTQFDSIEDLLAQTSLAPGEVPPGDVDALRNAAPLVLAAVEHGLAEVAAGRAGLEPDESADFVRSSWL